MRFFIKGVPTESNRYWEIVWKIKIHRWYIYYCYNLKAFEGVAFMILIHLIKVDLKILL